MIFGAATNKLLYIGVRNRLCLICRRAENKGTQPEQHTYYANSKKSSQATEADVLLLSTVSKNFKINLEGQNYVHFEVILSRNVKIFGTMASL